MPELTRLIFLLLKIKMVGENVWTYHEKCVSSGVKQRWPRWEISSERPVVLYQRIPGSYSANEALSISINVSSKA